MGHRRFNHWQGCIGTQLRIGVEKVHTPLRPNVFNALAFNPLGVSLSHRGTIGPHNTMSVGCEAITASHRA